MTERRGGATFSRSTWPRCCTLSPRSISAIVPRVGELGQTCGGKLFDRISGSHHDHTVASFVELLKPQATLSIASGVAAGFRSARRRLGELLDSRLRKFVDIWESGGGTTTCLLCIYSSIEVSVKHETGSEFLSLQLSLPRSS